MKKLVNDYLPLTHTTYFILLSLLKPLHGYGIMQKVEEISNGEVKLGPGTLYGALKKLEKDMLITKINGAERKKNYILTNFGKEILEAEYKRLERMIHISKHILHD
ncbi:PadR family transcriptional regulator [Bacillus seohaeanensis]|uniref:PadR family transcriptional regulator n=1 Tax=Bacillus seohaeanensis TaxID=284580 RepID=A0ABW5RND8_9BACI